MPVNSPEIAMRFIERARDAGVAIQIIPAVTQANLAEVAAVCHRYLGCLPAWGMHPMYIHVHRPEHLTDLRRQIETWRPVAIGEIGLDLFAPGLDFATQEYFYVEQLKIAREFDLPVLLHCRRANDQVLKQLRRFKVRGGIAHAFSGSRQQADAYLKLGFKLGFRRRFHLDAGDQSAGAGGAIAAGVDRAGDRQPRHSAGLAGRRGAARPQ
jgi:TatD DNase family protein